MKNMSTTPRLHLCSPRVLAEEPDRVRTLLEDVENVRRAKMYEGMGSAAQEVQQAVKVTDTLKHGINIVRIGSWERTTRC